MPLSPERLKERLEEEERWREYEKVAQSDVCEVCGAGLIVPSEKGKIVLRCSKDRSHYGHIRPDRVLENLKSIRKGIEERGGETAQIDEEIREYLYQKELSKGRRYGMTTGTALDKYKGSTALTKVEATEVLRTCFRDAPDAEIAKAAIMCATYGLNPLMRHLFLLKFHNKRLNRDEWAIVLSIKTDRVFASRQKAYGYKTLRLMTEAEEIEHHSRVDTSKMWAICILQDLRGLPYVGYGCWDRSDNVYGADKGNTQENMAMIRAERQALSRCCPDALPPLPPGAQVLDDQYIPDITVSDVPEPPPPALEQPKGTAEPQTAPADTTTGTSTTTVAGPETSPPQPESPNPARKAGKKKNPGTYRPRTWGELIGAASYYWDKSPADVKAVLGDTVPDNNEKLLNCWDILLKTWEPAIQPGLMDK